GGVAVDPGQLVRGIARRDDQREQPIDVAALLARLAAVDGGTDGERPRLPCEAAIAEGRTTGSSACIGASREPERRDREQKSRCEQAAHGYEPSGVDCGPPAWYTCGEPTRRVCWQ